MIFPDTHDTELKTKTAPFQNTWLQEFLSLPFHQLHTSQYRHCDSTIQCSGVIFPTGARVVVMDLNGQHHHNQSQSSPWLSLQKMISQGLYTSFLTSLPFMFYPEEQSLQDLNPFTFSNRAQWCYNFTAQWPESHPRIKGTYLIHHLSASLHKPHVSVNQGWYSKSTFSWYLLQWFLAPSIVRKMLRGTDFHRNRTWDTNCKVKVSKGLTEIWQFGRTQRIQESDIFMIRIMVKKLSTHTPRKSHIRQGLGWSWIQSIHVFS